MSDYENQPQVEVAMDDSDADTENAYDGMFGNDDQLAEEIAPKSRGRGRPKGKNPKGTASADGKKGVKKHKVKREEDRRYHSYIKKVHKTIHPDMSIHPNTVDVINTCLYDVMTPICEQAASMNARTGKATMTASDIKFAVKALWPKELYQHAEQEAIRALARSEGEDIDV